MNESADKATLLFRGQPVAELEAIFEHPPTWFAEYRLCPALPPGVQRFITFGREKLSVDAFEESELREHAEYIDSEDWLIETAGSTVRLDGAPLFSDSDVSWVV